MKLSILIPIICLTFISCNKTDNGNVNHSSSQPYQEDRVEVSIFDDTAHVNLDTLIGCFDGNKMDTLICEGIDSCTVRLYSTSGKIKPLQIDNVFGVFVLPEGDLDGNGTDDFGIRTEGFMGNWRDYSVYTLGQDGNWKYLIPPIIVYAKDFYEILSMGKDVVNQSKQKGYVDVRFSSWRNDEIYIVDTIIKVNPQPLNKLEEIGVIY
ncbi:MAG: hypothetical protein J5671_01145 [Bacteroidaceae bacterium]|nr:hypothetical protein [Bacteroidaceae bacterium]